jgi:hypothetical protein
VKDERWVEPKAGAPRYVGWAAFLGLDFFVTFCIKTKSKEGTGALESLMCL